MTVWQSYMATTVTNPDKYIYRVEAERQVSYCEVVRHKYSKLPEMYSLIHVLWVRRIMRLIRPRHRMCTGCMWKLPNFFTFSLLTRTNPSLPQLHPVPYMPLGPIRTNRV